MTRRSLLARSLAAFLAVAAVLLALGSCWPRPQHVPPPQPTARPGAMLAQVWLPVAATNAITGRGASVATYPARLCADMAALHVSWWYDWGTTGAGIIDCHAREYVPMIWGAITQTPALTGDSAWLLLQNEPNLPSQANMTPAQACETLLLAEASGRLLVSPATYASQTWDGGPWLADFMALCGAGRVQAIALHWYGCDAPALAAYLARRTAEYPGYPLWLTEWGCRGNEAQFAHDALPLIERYAARNAAWSLYTEPWYPEWLPLVRRDSGALTEYGAVYAGGMP